MAKRKSREDVRQEAVKLASGVDFFREWKVNQYKKMHGPNAHLNPDSLVMPGDDFLEVFDKIPGNGSAILIELREWYSHGLNDLRYFISPDQNVAEEGIQRFLKAFKAELGFDFLSESGLLKKTANKVLKRGRIANEKEWYLLRELQIDLSQTTLNEDELNQISELLNQFEVSQ